MPKVSTRQEQILVFLRNYHADQSYMPSVREIQAACGISSASVVTYNLRLLERGGYVRRSPGIARAIKLVERKGWEPVEATTIAVLSESPPADPSPESGAPWGGASR